MGKWLEFDTDDGEYSGQSAVPVGRRGNDPFLEAVKMGMSTLRMSALQKVREGLTTIEETVRVTDSDKGFGSIFSLGI